MKLIATILIACLLMGMLSATVQDRITAGMARFYTSVGTAQAKVQAKMVTNPTSTHDIYQNLAVSMALLRINTVVSQVQAFMARVHLS